MPAARAAASWALAPALPRCCPARCAAAARPPAQHDGLLAQQQLALGTPGRALKRQGCSASRPAPPTIKNGRARARANIAVLCVWWVGCVCVRGGGGGGGGGCVQWSMQSTTVLSAAPRAAAVGSPAERQALVLQRATPIFPGRNTTAQPPWTEPSTCTSPALRRRRQGTRGGGSRRWCRRSPPGPRLRPGGWSAGCTLR